jgi:hypothetical protein
MEFRYLGFDQKQNARVYRFDVLEKGEPARQLLVTADLALFRTHGVGIQEGPSLCAQKLAADLAGSSDGEHELTDADLRAYAAARADAETRKAAARRSGPRRSTNPGPAPESSPWRHFGV